MLSSPSSHLPPQVSQNWFPESERLLATSVLAMSLPLGIVLGQGCSPLFVTEAADVPVMNLVSPHPPNRLASNYSRCGWAPPPSRSSSASSL